MTPILNHPDSKSKVVLKKPLFRLLCQNSSWGCQAETNVYHFNLRAHIKIEPLSEINSFLLFDGETLFVVGFLWVPNKRRRS